MSVSQILKTQIGQVPAGTTFNYDELDLNAKDYIAAAKTMERLIKEGVIKRLSNGIFYKPRMTVFGELQPSEEELIKPYIFEKKKRIAYITGTALYNQMGLTTQVPKTIKIASSRKRFSYSNDILNIKSTLSYVAVSDENYKFLEILDAIKDFNKIQDISMENGIQILKNILYKLNEKDLKTLVAYSLFYPPKARAFLGALLEIIGSDVGLDTLKKSLNPLSYYYIGIEQKFLPSKENWHIK